MLQIPLCITIVTILSVNTFTPNKEGWTLKSVSLRKHPFVSTRTLRHCGIPTLYLPHHIHYCSKRRLAAKHRSGTKYPLCSQVYNVSNPIFMETARSLLMNNSTNSTEYPHRSEEITVKLCILSQLQHGPQSLIFFTDA